MSRRATIVFAAVVASGCSGTDGGARPSDARSSDAAVDVPTEGQPFTVSFGRDVYPVIAATCTESSCHDASRTTNHFSDFTTAARTYSRWVNGPGFDFCVDVPRDGIYTSRITVVPGDPEASYLVTKIAPPTDAPCQDPTHHRQMPPEPRPRLAAAVVDGIVTWIREGALQN